MASFIDSFPVASLPRVNDLGIDKKIFVADLNSSDDSIIDVGISKSNISSYIVRPSPRLLWSYAISPLSVIDAMEVKSEESRKTYVLAVTERKSFKLVVLVREQDEIISKQELDLPESAAGLKLDHDIIYIVEKSGGLRQAQLVDGTWSLAKFRLSETSGSKLLHFSFNQDLLVLITQKGTKLKYKLIALKRDNSIELKTHTEKASSGVFKVLANHIYKYDTKSKVLSKIRVNDFHVEKTVDLSPLMTSTSEVPVSMAVASPDRVVITDNSFIYLINSRFETLLDKFPLDNNSQNYIHNVMEVKGSSKNSLNSYLIFIKHNLKKNNSKLALVNFNVGMNNLSENIGKGFRPQPEKLHEISSLYDEKNKSDNLDKFFTKVQKYWDANDLTQFQLNLINYFKQKSRSKLNFEVFEIEKDAVVSVEFLQKVLELIFQREKGSLKFADESKVPEYLLVYLLTHKLYPKDYSKGILEILEEHPRLLRQAIITCPNIPLQDLLLEVIQLDNKEILTDLIARLTNDFSIVDITIEFKSIFARDSKINFDYLLNELIKIDNADSWLIIQGIIDIIGIFSLGPDLIDKMIQLIDMRVEAINLNSYNAVLLKQARGDKAVKKTKVPVYSVEKLEI